MSGVLCAEDFQVTGARATAAMRFRLPIGARTAVVGRNGSGKSTLLLGLLGVLPTRGQLHWAQTPLHALSAAARAPHMSYVPQTTQLRANVSVEVVVGLAVDARTPPFVGRSAEDQTRIEQALVDTQTEAIRHRSFAELSGGEQRRALIARALVTQSPAILLDEPTAHLDADQRFRMYDLFLKLQASGKTLIMALHDLAYARDTTDHTLVLENCALKRSGPSREVLSPDTVRTDFGVGLNLGPPSFVHPLRGDES